MPSYVAKIPKPLPAPYNAFHVDWISWVYQINGKSLTLSHKGGCITNQGVRQGRFVIAEGIEPPGDAVNWLPGAWIRERTVSQSSQPNPCDCTPRKLFQQGCKGH